MGKSLVSCFFETQCICLDLRKFLITPFVWNKTFVRPSLAEHASRTLTFITSHQSDISHLYLYESDERRWEQETVSKYTAVLTTTPSVRLQVAAADGATRRCK